MPPPPLLTGHEPGDDETGQLSEGDGDDDVMLGGVYKKSRKEARNEIRRKATAKEFILSQKARRARDTQRTAKLTQAKPEAVL